MKLVNIQTLFVLQIVHQYQLLFFYVVSFGNTLLMYSVFCKQTPSQTLDGSTYPSYEFVCMDV